MYRNYRYIARYCLLTKLCPFLIKTLMTKIFNCKRYRRMITRWFKGIDVEDMCAQQEPAINHLSHASSDVLHETFKVLLYHTKLLVFKLVNVTLMSFLLLKFPKLTKHFLEHIHYCKRTFS